MGFTIDVGKPAPEFNLPGVDGRNWKLSDFKDKRLVVIVFSCNHCPYVVGSEDRIMKFQGDYAARGLQLLAINSNETEGHPEDSFDHMVARAKERGFNFPYLRDEDQSIAKAYGAQRTPHFFLLDENRIVRYTGRMDNNPRDEAKVETHELRDAVEDLFAGRDIAVKTTDAIGCNVKWWGKERHWMPADICDFV